MTVIIRRNPLFPATQGSWVGTHRVLNVRLVWFLWLMMGWPAL